MNPGCRRSVSDGVRGLKAMTLGEMAAISGRTSLERARRLGDDDDPARLRQAGERLGERQRLEKDVGILIGHAFRCYPAINRATGRPLGPGLDASVARILHFA